MAKITVTTDEGEVIETWRDQHDQIGHTHRTLNRQQLIAEIIYAVDKARVQDGRNKNGYKKV